MQTRSNGRQAVGKGGEEKRREEKGGRDCDTEAWKAFRCRHHRPARSLPAFVPSSFRSSATGCLYLALLGEHILRQNQLRALGQLQAREAVRSFGLHVRARAPAAALSCSKQRHFLGRRGRVGRAASGASAASLADWLRSVRSSFNMIAKTTKLHATIDLLVFRPSALLMLDSYTNTLPAPRQSWELWACATLGCRLRFGAT